MLALVGKKAGVWVNGGFDKRSTKKLLKNLMKCKSIHVKLIP